ISPPAGARPAIPAGAPGFSPDGSKVAFAGDFEYPGVAELYVVDLALGTPGPARLAHPSFGPSPPLSGVAAFAWSPDGRSLAYAADGDVFIVALSDPSAPRNLSANSHTCA